MGKKIGIITMHKVLNYGSALQAFALQNVIEKMGHNVEIIDYIYPNEYHKQFQPQQSKIRKIVGTVWEILRGRPQKRKANYFESFYNTRLNLSTTYRSQEELLCATPTYDIYMTGSDQVWNPKSIHEDTSFMLSFTPSPNKVAFAASFAMGELPDKYKQLYATELMKYKNIFVREKRGQTIITELIGYEPDVVVDPTLLLTCQEWREFATRSTITIQQPYILVYVLGYSFDVYPYACDLIKYVQQKLGLRVVVLNMSNKYAQKLSHKTIVKDASVYDFVKLFADAALVLTDSFHGTAFSLNLNTPFYSIVNNVESLDSRIVDLLNMTNEEHRVIRKGEDYKAMTFAMEAPNNGEVAKLRESSIAKLQGAIENIHC